MDYVIDTTTENLHSTGGIALAGKIFEKIGFGQQHEAHPTIKHPEILGALAGLLVQGRSSYEELSLFRNDDFFRDSLNLKHVPVPTTLRLYLEAMIPYKSTVLQTIDTANM